MKKALKTILAIVGISALSYGVIFGAFALGFEISIKLNAKRNEFDISKDSWMGFSYELAYDSKEMKKGETVYTYVSNDKDPKVMESSTPLQMTDPYTPYQINVWECFDHENSNLTDKRNGKLLKKEVKDKDGNAIAYNQKFDPIFDFIENHDCQIMPSVEVYDMRSSLIIAYENNANLTFDHRAIGYFSSTYQNGELLTLDTTKITGIHLFSER